MTTTEREERIAELAAMMQEWGMTRRETLLEMLVYMAIVAGRWEPSRTQRGSQTSLTKRPKV